MVRPSPAAVFGAAVGAGFSVVVVCTRQVPSRGVGSRSRKGVIGGLMTLRVLVPPEERGMASPEATPGDAVWLQALLTLRPSTRKPALLSRPILMRSRRLMP